MPTPSPATVTKTLDILIVKLSSLGDVVQTAAVISDIVRHYPHATIDWVVEESFAPLLRSVQGIRTVIPIRQRRWNRLGLKQFFDAATRADKKAFLKTLHAAEYDVVIDAQGLIKSGLVTRQARLKKQRGTALLAPNKTPFRATFGNRSETCGYEWPVRWCTNVHIPMPTRIHAVQRTRLLCARALGYDEAILQKRPQYDWNLATQPKTLSVLTIKGEALKLAELKVRPYIVLVHGSSRADNSWPIAHWQSITQQLGALGYDVLLPQSSALELNQAQAIAAPHNHAHVLQACDLLKIAHIIQGSAGVIGLDTGLSHIAVALDKPCLHIFMHDRAWRAGPLEGELGVAYQQYIYAKNQPSPNEVMRLFHTLAR